MFVEHRREKLVTLVARLFCLINSHFSFLKFPTFCTLLLYRIKIVKLSQSCFLSHFHLMSKLTFYYYMVSTLLYLTSDIFTIILHRNVLRVHVNVLAEATFVPRILS